jgi:hypothetical protein
MKKPISILHREARRDLFANRHFIAGRERLLRRASCQ